MHKFSKTAYPRHANNNHSNMLTSLAQNKNKLQGLDQTKGRTQQQIIVSGHHAIQNKIQIDSTLLFSSKQNGRAGRTGNTNDRTNGCNTRGQFANTINDGFIKKNKQRPQSKQQSRVKVIDNASLSKRKQELVQRPQTSKGQRNVVYRPEARNKSLADQSEHDIEIKRQSKTSLGTRRRNTAKQLQLQTSIDPEFLALFAS